MTVYVDILFLTNFTFDAQILILLCKIYSKKVSVLRIILSSCIGGLVGVFAVLPYFEIFSRPVFRYVLPIFFIYYIFYPINLKGFVSRYLSFLTISFIYAGVIDFVGISAFWGIGIFGFIYILICNLRKNITRKKAETYLEYKGKVISAEGFYDSGNMLTSGGLPVILGNDRVFEKLFNLKMSKDDILSFSDKTDIRIIPFKSLGENGTVIGIKLDSVRVKETRYENVVLAYCGNKFSDELILNSVMT